MIDELKARAVCHACASQPRAWLCPVCDNELAALKAGQGEAVAYVKPDSPIKGHTEFCRHETWMIDEGENIMIAGGWFPLYLSAQPASADAVSVPREFPAADDHEKAIGWEYSYEFISQVERMVASRTEFTASMESVQETLKAACELRALLAQSQEVK